MENEYKVSKKGLIFQIVLMLIIILIPNHESKYSYNGEWSSGPGWEFLLNNLIFAIITLIATVNRFSIAKLTIKNNNQQIKIYKIIKYFIILVFFILFASYGLILLLIVIFNGSKTIALLINFALLLISAICVFKMYTSFVNKKKSKIKK